MLSSARRGAPASTSILLLVTREQDSLNRTWDGAFHPNLCYLVTVAAVWQCTRFGVSLRENELSILAQLHNLHIVPLKATYTHFRVCAYLRDRFANDLYDWETVSPVC